MSASARDRGERGQVTLLITGFATVLLMAMVVVVDASAAYLQRQGLNTLADGAALAGVDAGSHGETFYEGGLGVEQLPVSAAEARAGVASYLGSVGAAGRYPGLSWQVGVDEAGGRVEVRLRAPLDLPLTFPGSPQRAMIGASASAVVTVERD